MSRQAPDSVAGAGGLKTKVFALRRQVLSALKQWIIPIQKNRFVQFGGSASYMKPKPPA